MWIQIADGRHLFFRARGVVIATMLVGLMATGTAPPAGAGEVQDPSAASVDLAAPTGLHPEPGTRTLAMAVGRSIPDEAPLDIAIRTLLCLEAREAIRHGAVDRPALDWILTEAHSCRDDEMLVDALGF